MPVKKSDTKEPKLETPSNKAKDNKDTKENNKDSKDVKNLKEAKVEPTKEKNTKQTKETKSSKEIIEDEEEDDVVDEDEDEDDEDGEENTDTKKKEKKPKKTFVEVFAEFENKNEEIKQKEILISETEKTLKSLKNEKDKLDRERNKLVAQFEKAHEDDLTKASKDKPSKRNGNPNGGFNRKYKVPGPILKFCKLVDGVEMNYPELMSILNDKFKEGGMKEGQLTVLNADAAKIFKKEKGHVIKFGEIMTFIKEMIEAEAPKNETTVKI